jgi:hypothetical protein
MKQEEIITYQLKSIKSAVENLLELINPPQPAQNCSLPKPTYTATLPKAMNVFVSVPEPDTIGQAQGNFFFYKLKSQGVPEQVWKPLVQKFTADGTAFTPNILKKHVKTAATEIEALCQQSNPHYPEPQYLGDGSQNPAWGAKISLLDVED